MAPTHPLDPLTVEEIALAAELVRAVLQPSEHARFAGIRLQEPSKGVVRSFRDGDPIERQAFCVVMDERARSLHEVVVSLVRREVLSVEERSGMQGPILLDDVKRADALIRNDPKWQAAIRKRGISRLDDVRIDPWMVGNFGIPEEEGRRVVASLSYLQQHPRDNPYARPIEGVIAYVDLNQDRIMKVVDTGVVPIPNEPGRYDVDAVGPLRDGLRPLMVHQPKGASFELRGHELRWQRWRIRFSFNTREGLVIHTVGYEDGGSVRPILYRASVNEMVVPYGDVSDSHFFQGAFDAGDFGLGKGVNSLVLGCDCLGEITYVDVAMADELGEPMIVPNAICIHEEDYGLLWKHHDLILGHTESRRSRRLVVSSISTLLNYEYGFYWYFYQDGTIQFEVKLTGIVQTAAVADGTHLPHAELVAPGLAAMHHQHLFNVRLDMEVDGLANTVYELDALPADEGPANPYGSAIVTKATQLERESKAKRKTNASASRSWIVQSDEQQNVLGHPTAYKLAPVMSTPTLLAYPDSPVGRRASFARYNLWVTPFDPDERHAGGEYPNQHPGSEGLPAWTSKDRSIIATDVVLWYSFGLTHIVRLEDWPVMPVEWTGFMLRPWGFFDQNPALDVPPSMQEHCET